MLVPGEYLIVPVPAEAQPHRPIERGAQPAPAPKVEAEEQAGAAGPEARSFLLILLRSLGAVHT